MIVLTLLIRGYVLVGLIFFSFCFGKFLQDKTAPKTDKNSWIVLGLATIFWPIVIPVSHLERQANRKVVRADQYEEVEYRLCAPPLVERQKSSDLKLSPTFASPSESRCLKDSNIA